MLNLRSQRVRAWFFQIALVGLLIVLVVWLLNNTLGNMRIRGIQSGFDFLLDPAGFDIGESMFAFASTQTYGQAFLVGLFNTLRVSCIAIVICTLWGTVLGIGRLSGNALARGLCYAYTEVFRNIPLLLQLLTWYVVLVELMPDTETPLQFRDWLLLSKEGLALPGFMSEGMTLTPEFLALTWGLTLYTSAFVAEVIRSGIQSVPRGQVEAALSIGLSPWLRLRLVVLPQALRLIVPPLTNQYLNAIKNSSLAVAIGYPDLVSISNTSLNQTGRAVECIAIVMAVYLTLSLLTASGMHYFNRRAALKER
ncbi:MAG: ABC transporter permease subunit [Burkholderiales bacterium]|nr:ABC transporter permease subunit [Burkholderiales bacterium]